MLVYVLFIFHSSIIIVFIKFLFMKYIFTVFVLYGILYKHANSCFPKQLDNPALWLTAL